jgi:hypothetical protein
MTAAATHSTYLGTSVVLFNSEGPNLGGTKLPANAESTGTASNASPPQESTTPAAAAPPPTKSRASTQGPNPQPTKKSTKQGQKKR